MANITITRTTFTDDDGSGTTGTLWTAAQITSIYDQIDAVVAKLQDVICDGRLTLTSGSPVTTADVTGATNIYWSPYRGNRIALYDGSAAWATITFTETTQALGTLVNGQAYDVFAYNTSGTLSLEVVEWKNATVTVTIATPGVVTWASHGMSTGMTFIFTTSGALPTGLTANTVYFVTVVDANSFKLSTTLANVAAGTFIATSGTQSGTHTGHSPNSRQTALVLQDGVYVKSGTTTRRYLGTFGTTSTTTTEDSAAKRMVWNYYNRTERTMRVVEATASWTYTTAAYRQANGSAANQLECIIGLSEASVDVQVSGSAANSSAANNVNMLLAVGLDSSNTASAGYVNQYNFNPGANTNIPIAASWRGYPGIGRHALTWLEYSTAVGVTTWIGTSAIGATLVQSGIIGTIRN